MMNAPLCPCLPGWYGRVVLAALVPAAVLRAAPAAAPEEAPATLSPLLVTAWRESETSPLASRTPIQPDGPRLVDVLGKVPGLLVQDSFGGFDPPRLAVRGSGLQSAPTSRGLALSLFGLPLNAADGSFNLALLESEWFDAAELTRGTAAGAPALGGSLALTPDAFAPGARVAASYGSYDATAVHARGVWSHDRLALAGRGAYTYTGGWRGHSLQRREGFHAALRTPLDDRSELIVQALAAMPYLEVPGPLTKAQALDNPTINSPAVRRDRPRRDTGYYHLNATATRRLDDTRLSASAGTTYTDDLFYQLLPNGISDTQAWDAYVRLMAEREWAGDRQRTTLAALLQSGWWDMRRYRTNRGEMGLLIGDAELRPTTFTAALDHRVKLDERNHIDVGGSLLGARRDYDDRLPTGLDLDVNGARFAPRVAWIWQFAPEVSFTASWSRSFEPPTYGDLVYTTGAAPVLRTANLDWQRADNFEIGCQGRHERWSWSVLAYHAPWQGEFLRLVDATGATRGTVNAGHTLHRGLETGLQYQLYRDAGWELTLGAAHTFSMTRFDNDPVYGDRDLGGVPPLLGSVTLRLDAPGGWFIAPSCDWRSGSTYADHFNTQSYGGNAIWSLRFGRRHPDGWSATVGIDNLFDRGTIASTAGVLDRAGSAATTSVFLPAMPRTVSLRLEYAW